MRDLERSGAPDCDEAASAITERVDDLADELIDVAEIGLADAAASASRASDLALWTGVGVVTLLSVASVFVIRRVIRPLRRLVGRAEALAAGRVDDAVGSGFGDDEMGRLAVAFDEAATAMRERFEIEEQRRRIAQAREAMIADVRAVADGLVTCSDEISSASVQYLAAADAISHRSVGARDLSDLALQRLEESRVEIDTLLGASAEVVAVIDAVEQIAGQTKLLALNATIEAVQAGDAGRGFIIVADEVKELAKETSDATGRVAATVGGIRERASSVGAASDRLGEDLRALIEGSSAVGAAVAEQRSASLHLAQLIGGAGSADTWSGSAVDAGSKTLVGLAERLRSLVGGEVDGRSGADVAVAGSDGAGRLARVGGGVGDLVGAPERVHAAASPV